MIKGHGGDVYHLARELGCLPSQIVDMSSNVNPLGPMPELMDYLKTRLGDVVALPDVDAGGICGKWAQQQGLGAESVLAGNGTTQFIYTIPQALTSRNVLIVGPTYADYADACRLQNAHVRVYHAQASQGFRADLDQISAMATEADLVFICNPNNPTGQLIPADSLEAICRTLPHVRFVVDESYLPFVRDGDRHTLLKRRLANVMVLCSFSKIFRIPGLRTGFMVAPPELINVVRPHMAPWSVNTLAQSAADWLIRHPVETEAFVTQTRGFVTAEMDKIFNRLGPLDTVDLYKSQTDFLLIRLSGPLTASAVCHELARNRILIRNCSNFDGLSERYIRISLKSSGDNDDVVQRLVPLLSGGGSH